MTTWTPATIQAETWISESGLTRGFDPAGFDNSPRFDTGGAGGSWTQNVIQAETWTPEI
jgi:hypothetical protein